MNWKRLLVIVVVVLVAGMAALIGAWGERQAVSSLGSRVLTNSFLGLTLPGFGKEKMEEPLIRERSDVLKLPYPPSPPANSKELKQLVDRIVDLEFPECELAKSRKSSDCKDRELSKNFSRCMERINYEVVRIRQIRDKSLVPELIRVAEKQKYRYDAWVKSACDDIKAQFVMNICQMRFQAIYALGEIKDERAVDPLLSILNEPPPNFSNLPENLLEYGCAVPGDADGIGYTCGEALKALLKMNVAEARQGLLPELMSALDEVDLETVDGEEKFEQAIRAGCKLGMVPAYGSSALEALVEKYQETGISEEKKEAVLRSIWKIRDPKAVPQLKEFVHGGDPKLAFSAARALAGMADPALLPEYIWMVEKSDNGLVVQAGCNALGKLKDPSTVKYLMQVLQTVHYDAAAFALTEMGPMAREAVPVLIKKLEDCDSCRTIAGALGVIKDEAAVPALLEFVLKNSENGGMEAVSALGGIGTDSAVEALKKISIGKDFVNPQAVGCYSRRWEALQNLWAIRGKKENSFFCSMKDDPEMGGNISFYNYCQSNSE